MYLGAQIIFALFCFLTFSVHSVIIYVVANNIENIIQWRHLQAIKPSSFLLMLIVFLSLSFLSSFLCHQMHFDCFMHSFDVMIRAFKTTARKSFASNFVQIQFFFGKEVSFPLPNATLSFMFSCLLLNHWRCV